MATKKQVESLLSLIENEKQANDAATAAREAIKVMVANMEPGHYLTSIAKKPVILRIHDGEPVTILELLEFDDDGFGL